MVVVVLALAVAITGYVGWLMWNAPASPPLPPGTNAMQYARDRVLSFVRSQGARSQGVRRMAAARMRQWEHRPTA